MASSPHQAPLDLPTNTPKDYSRGPPTPPPAYFGPRTVLNPTMFAARLAAAHPPAYTHLARQPARTLLPATRWHDLDSACASSSASSNLDDDDDDDNDGGGDGDDGDSSSAITVRISTAVRVTGARNVVHLAADPAATARFVADAVTRVLDGGIPMIDEEGRPRPVRIEIEAGVEVRGKGNVVGALAGKRKRVDREEEEEEEREEEVGRARRRRRGSA